MDTKDTQTNKKPHAIGITKKNFLSYLLIIIISIVIIVGLIVPILQGNLRFLTVLSGSMDPTIRAGDVILIQSADPEDVHINDIITYKHASSENPDQYITHRVVNITKESTEIQDKNTIYFKTKGDANDNPDSYRVKQENLVGKHILTIPLIGYLVNFIHQPIGLLIFIFIPGTAIIFFELKKIIKITKKV